MNDDQLRALVRASVARHLGRAAAGAGLPEMPPAAPMAPATAMAVVAAGVHPSHGVYLALVNTGDACVIEPGVPCNHCNYCRSHGH